MWDSIKKKKKGIKHTWTQFYMKGRDFKGSNGQPHVIL